MHIPTRNKFTGTSDFLKSDGFTIIELLVSVAIMVIITGVVLVQNNSFNNSIALTNLVYEIGLSVREAQTFGISARQIQGQQGNDIRYGVYFNAANNKQYVIFADLDNDGSYDDGSGVDPSELVRGFEITRGNFISSFCATRGVVTTCTDSVPVAIQTLSILFKRPNPDALIFTDKDLVNPYGSAILYVESPDGFQKCVTVQQTGQVSIETTC